MDSPIPSELKHPILLEIGLDWFFDRHIRGIHGFATVSKEYGLYTQQKDPSEQYLHVDFPTETSHLAHIYPKHLWTEAVKRWEETKKRSEEDRQNRFLQELRMKELQAKYKKREETIEHFLLKMERKFADSAYVKTNSRKTRRQGIILLLTGQGNEKVATLLGIDSSEIEEFKQLPQPAGDEESLLLLTVQEPTIVNPEPIVREG